MKSCDGHECLQVAREQQPDLIMIDLSMPRLDGWKVLQELKTDSRTSNIPCVAVTAYADFNQHRAHAAGFDAYLSKPFRIETVLEVVKELLSEPRSGSEKVARRATSGPGDYFGSR